MMRELELDVQDRVTESRDWEYQGVQWSTRIESVGNSHRKFVIEEELEVSL
jgi:hypothetical protein